MTDDTLLAQEFEAAPAAPARRWPTGCSGSTERSRRCRAGGLAAAEPNRLRCSVENLRRLADHGRRPRLPRHAARAEGARANCPTTTSSRSSATDRGRTRRRRRDRRLRRTGDAGRAREPLPRRAASRSSCTTCSGCPSRRSARSPAAPPTPPASSPAGPGGGCAAPHPLGDTDLAEQRRVIDAFLAAARAGDFEALLEVLDPDVVFRVHAAEDDPRAVGLPAERSRSGSASASSREGRPFAPLARPATSTGRRVRSPSGTARHSASCRAQSAAAGS